jgi:hypothetical protein
VLLVYLAATALAVRWHEPFRDEAQKWLIARDAPGLLALLRLVPYEGSPALWPLLLRPLARLGAPYAAMSWLNWACMAGAAALLWLRAPLPRAVRLLALFSYFFLYDFAAIARNYALFTLLAFGAAALHGTRRERPVRYALVLVLLMNANLFGTDRKSVV